MASRRTVAAKPGSNEPPKIIVKKIIADDHGGHHGGAWKVAYADFVTAMMAFFLLMWLLGATTEKQRKALADYFAPTLVEYRQNSAGSHGLLGGSSLTEADHYPHRAAQTGTRAMTVPLAADGGNREGTGDKGSLRSESGRLRNEDTQNFRRLRERVTMQLAADPRFAKVRRNIRFVPTRDGLRIDLIDNADYSMFALGTTALQPEAAELIDTVAKAVVSLDNAIAIRGHTDSLRYGDPRAMNNWMLSTGRAEATRRRLAMGQIGERRFERIEGVADREPFIAADPADPRNRRVSVTLLYRRGG